MVNIDKVLGIISPQAAPVKRMVQNAKDSGIAIDATCGRKMKSVLVMESGHIMLSSLLPETISKKVIDK